MLETGKAEANVGFGAASRRSNQLVLGVNSGISLALNSWTVLMASLNSTSIKKENLLQIVTLLCSMRSIKSLSQNEIHLMWQKVKEKLVWSAYDPKMCPPTPSYHLGTMLKMPLLIITWTSKENNPQSRHSNGNISTFTKLLKRVRIITAGYIQRLGQSPSLHFGLSSSTGWGLLRDFINFYSSTSPVGGGDDEWILRITDCPTSFFFPPDFC